MRPYTTEELRKLRDFFQPVFDIDLPDDKPHSERWLYMKYVSDFISLIEKANKQGLTYRILTGQIKEIPLKQVP